MEQLILVRSLFTKVAVEKESDIVCSCRQSGNYFTCGIIWIATPSLTQWCWMTWAASDSSPFPIFLSGILVGEC
ncbi:MAG: hypothetical protein ACI9JR_003168 [Gammaproteobacteria bacterium]|jgi:hypothetical protein